MGLAVQEREERRIWYLRDTEVPEQARQGGPSTIWMTSVLADKGSLHCHCRVGRLSVQENVLSPQDVWPWAAIQCVSHYQMYLLSGKAVATEKLAMGSQKVPECGARGPCGEAVQNKVSPRLVI